MQRLLLRFFISGFNVLNRIHKSYILGYLDPFTAGSGNAELDTIYVS